MSCHSTVTRQNGQFASSGFVLSSQKEPQVPKSQAAASWTTQSNALEALGLQRLSWSVKAKTKGQAIQAFLPWTLFKQSLPVASALNCDSARANFAKPETMRSKVSCTKVTGYYVQVAAASYRCASPVLFGSEISKLHAQIILRLMQLSRHTLPLALSHVEPKHFGSAQEKGLAQLTKQI